MQTLHKTLLRALCLIVILASGTASAQIIYGIGAANNTLNGAGTEFANPFNRIYIINPTTGLASNPAIANSLPTTVTESVAIGVSPINGLVYWVERAVETPRIGTWNPSTGATSIIGNASTPVGINSFLRATFCPDGKFYIASNGSLGGTGAEIYQLNPVNLSLVRTVVVTNVPTNGSGDVVCTSNGDMYVAARTGGAGTVYGLYQITQTQLAVAGNLSIASTVRGNISTDATQQLTGLSEAPNGNLIASAALNQTATYSIATSTAVATTLSTVVGVALGDLSREFPRDVSVSKSVTPTTSQQGTTTVSYTLIVRNPGPAVAGNIGIVDLLPLAGVNTASATWACSITAAGAATAMTSACATPTGTGAVSTTVSLSIVGTAQFIISVPTLPGFSGTLTNTATASLTSNTFDSDTSNNIVTRTSTVTGAANLSVTKSDGVTTTVAGTTNTYTATFVNSGPGDGAGSTIKDTPSAGLSNCSVAACTGTGTPTAAVCPIPLNNLLSPTGILVATFPANTSLIYTLRCGVSATGQ